MNLKIAQIIATNPHVMAQVKQVVAAIELLDAGDTIPFIARYRKEVTHGLTDTQLRTIGQELILLRELEDRRKTIIKSIESQGKLSPELLVQIEQADSKPRLEDLYLPYKPKRRSKAQIAKEAGLEPLAFKLLSNRKLIPESEAANYVNPEKDVNDDKTALEGARAILMEHFSENADLIGQLRECLKQEGIVSSRVKAGQEEPGHKFKDYFEYQEPIAIVPSHRLLAILRGRNEGILKVEIQCNHDLFEQRLRTFFDVQNHDQPADPWLLETIRWTWKIKLFGQLETELIGHYKEQADHQAIEVFALNLRDLLMTSPAGNKNILGLDPGFRTGVKIAIIDRTGKVLEHETIYPHPPQNQWNEAIEKLKQLCALFKVEYLSIGNGTASRETDLLATELIRKHPDLQLGKILISEAGASVYSASELASKEFPNLDVSIRGAVSIARRLQDPLAELVKIDPKSIGVGQYQHDVNQVKLSQSLEAVVEDCVNSVGVDVNTASSALLSRVAGLNAIIAKNIVEFRDIHGPFKKRQELMQVSRLGSKTFEQAAGFLRIVNGENPLDASAVHPESYPIIEKILSKSHKSIQEIIGNQSFLKNLIPNDYTDEKFGTATIVDIIKELEKPGRDPRPEFKTARFNESINAIGDLKVGMILEGAVTNVANFGAFVDLGVHQDGLIHISELSNQFVKNPRDVIKTGDIVKVKVIGVDLPRKRISLTLKLQDKHQAVFSNNDSKKQHKPKQQYATESVFASVLKEAIKNN